MIQPRFLDVDQAKAIIAAFGPCTSLYECCAPEELVERFNDAMTRDAEETIHGYLGILLRVESASAERMDSSGACYREWIADRPAVIAGLTALGYEVAS